MISEQDVNHMKTCLALAARAEGRTAPNPMVGALVLNSGGLVVGEGFHARAGLAHAEVMAFEEAAEACRGGTLYVNLEPCAHHGKTPPCIDSVIASGVERVVAGMVDPNPRVAGKGIAALKAAGLSVEVGVLEEQCRWLNRGFIKKMTEGLPWLCLKLATTLDGKIADRTGSSRWISGAQARQHVHRLRNSYDCVLVGGATAVCDDPELNVRDIADSRDPIRAVIDPDLKVSPGSRLCQQDTGGRTVIFCLDEAKTRRGKDFPSHVQVVPIENDSAREGHLNLASALRWLASDGALTVLCEGGGRLSAGLLTSGLVDEIQWIVSAKILGDAEAVPAVAPMGAVLLDQSKKLQKVTFQPLGQDVLVCGHLCADSAGDD